MESQLEDIRNSTTLKIIQQLEDSIIDCAKNFKSNDATFNINTLPTFSQKLIELMGKYSETSRKILACQGAFVNIHGQLEEEDAGELDEYADTNKYMNLFDKFVRDEFKSLTKNTKSVTELKKIINMDEEIRVEAPSCNQIPKDPITKMDISFAVRSSVCNHVYDKNSIELYITQKESTKKRIQCPQAGCANKNMTKGELVADNDVNKLIQSLL